MSHTFMFQDLVAQRRTLRYISSGKFCHVIMKKLQTMVVVLILALCLASVLDAKRKHRKRINRFKPKKAAVVVAKKLNVEEDFIRICELNSDDNKNNIKIVDIGLIDLFNQMMEKCEKYMGEILMNMNNKKENKSNGKSGSGKVNERDVTRLCRKNKDESDALGIETLCEDFVARTSAVTETDEK